MLGPYAIALGRGEHRHALESRAGRLGLTVRVQTEQMLLVASADTALLETDRAVLVGRIFNAANERLTKPPAELETWADAGKREPLPKFWGNFAFFSTSGEHARVYRDPSGSVQVYRCAEESESVFVSNAEFASQLGLLQGAKVDPRFIVHWLQYPFLRTRRTGILGVEELLPGMLLARSGSGRWRESSAWHPSVFAGQPMYDPAESAGRLRDTALKIVSVQATTPNIALRLSGGLDSSIIAACLAKAHCDFHCINFATLSRDGDEREHARTVARAFGARLVEVGEPAPGPLEVPDRLSFRPLINPLLAPFETAIGHAANALGALSFIDGGGGDNLFCSISSAAPVIDTLRSLRLGDTAAVVRDIASRADCTIWEVLAAAARRLLKRRPAWKEDRSFLDSGSLIEEPELHPWLLQLRVPPGKREHVEALVHVQHFLDRAASPIERVHPLLAQPLLELCLQIPSWLWLRGGRDRAIARDAFNGLVPSSVLQRRMKGSLQGMLYRSFSMLRSSMSDLLVEGELAKMQIIDTPAIGEALKGDAWMRDEIQLRISEMVALELWVRSWRS